MPQTTVEGFLFLRNLSYVEEKENGKGCFIVAAADTMQKSWMVLCRAIKFSELLPSLRYNMMVCDWEDELYNGYYNGSFFQFPV